MKRKLRLAHSMVAGLADQSQQAGLVIICPGASRA